MGTSRRPQPQYLPAKLLQIRQSLGLTQEQMAKRLESVKSPPQPGQISRFEQGKREPSLLVLLEYARLAGVTIEVLVDDELVLLEKLPASPKSEGSRRKQPSCNKS